MISVEQQFAEKIHAYTLPRGNQPNSRVRDIVDFQLLIRNQILNIKILMEVLKKIFKIRNTHPLPLELPYPPLEWTESYEELAKTCGLETNLGLAFKIISDFYKDVIKIDHK